VKTEVKTMEFTLSRTMRGAAADLYDAWLDPKCPGGLWFGVERVILNTTVDGLFYHVVAHEGKSWAHYGRFTRLDRGRVIEYTWVSEATRGLESLVTITLARHDDGTEVTLRHSNLPDDEMGLEHKAGWGWNLEMLAKKFDKVATGK
jgi:uncharacterized protein YndB with AHSA1/START domain